MFQYEGVIFWQYRHSEKKLFLLFPDGKLPFKNFHIEYILQSIASDFAFLNQIVYRKRARQTKPTK